MIDLGELRLLHAIAGARSLAAAARTLDVTPPAVSQRLAQLEARLKLRLVDRGPGGLRLTAEGEMMAERAGQILGQLAVLTEDLAECRGQMVGPLRVIAPLGFGRVHIAPLLSSFALLHPEVTPILTVTDDPRGAMRLEAWDLLIHVGRLPELDMPHRRLAPNRRLLCASPGYIERHGVPTSPRDLRKHRCGVVREDQADVSLLVLTGPGGQRETIRIGPSFASNDGEVIRAWVLAGLGIAERSEWSIAEDIQAGRLTRILPDWGLPDADVVALMNPRSVRAARIEALLEYMKTAMSSPEWATDR